MDVPPTSAYNVDKSTPIFTPCVCRNMSIAEDESVKYKSSLNELTEMSVQCLADIQRVLDVTIRSLECVYRTD